MRVRMFVRGGYGSAIGYLRVRRSSSVVKHQGVVDRVHVKKAAKRSFIRWPKYQDFRKLELRNNKRWDGLPIVFPERRTLSK